MVPHCDIVPLTLHQPHPETPISLNLGIFLNSYQGPYYNLRYIPLLRDIGVSGHSDSRTGGCRPSQKGRVLRGGGFRGSHGGGAGAVAKATARRAGSRVLGFKV